MGMWLHYDSWRLDNNEQACTCDKCESKVSRESDLHETTTGDYYCKSCVDDYVSCKCCGRAIVHSDYDYDNTCDDCITEDFKTCPTCEKPMLSNDYGYKECDICVDNRAEQRYQEWKDSKFDKPD